MQYDEQSFDGFEIATGRHGPGFHFAHIVAWLEQKRLARIHAQARRIIQENRYAR